MTMPNFLIIGAAKSGTTSLYSYLEQHPQVYMSPVKEPHFFAYEDERLDYRGPFDERWFNSKVVTKLEEYQKLFAAVTDEKAIGEASTSYLNHIKAPDRIKHYVPDAKLIAILRDPVERAYSAYMMLVSSGYEPCLDFREAIRLEQQRIRDKWAYAHYMSRSFYFQYLKRYYELCEPSQIKVLLYEDLKYSPAKVVADLYRFLGVDDTFQPSIKVKHNVSVGVPRNAILHNLLKKNNIVKSLVRPFVPMKFRKKIRTAGYRISQLDSNLRAELIGVLRNDILDLQDLIERDLSVWFK